MTKIISTCILVRLIEVYWLKKSTSVSFGKLCLFFWAAVLSQLVLWCCFLAPGTWPVIDLFFYPGQFSPLFFPPPRLLNFNTTVLLFRFLEFWWKVPPQCWLRNVNTEGEDLWRLPDSGKLHKLVFLKALNWLCNLYLPMLLSDQANKVYQNDLNYFCPGSKTVVWCIKKFPGDLVNVASFFFNPTLLLPERMKGRGDKFFHSEDTELLIVKATRRKFLLSSTFLTFSLGPSLCYFLTCLKDWD